MKTELSKIAKDLEQGTITENEARTILLGLLGVVSEAELPNGELSIEIEGVNYPLQKEVFDLLLMTSKERDYYRDIVQKLEQMPNDVN